MSKAIIIYLPYLLSVTTIYTMLLAGNKSKKAWLIGLLNQVLWFVWIIVSGTWGLLPTTIAMSAIYVRNYIKWKNE